MHRQTEKRVRKEVLAAFDRQTFKQFICHHPWRVVWTFTHIWVGIAVAFALGLWAWSSPDLLPKLLIPWLVLYLGTRHNAFAVQIHEASHKLLFVNARVNDAFCNLFGAYWILNDVESYRRVHLIHHTDLHLETDPDLNLYRLPKDGRRYLIAKTLLRDLLWFTALQRIAGYLKHPKSRERTGGAAPRLHLAGKLGSQAILVSSSIALLGGVQGTLFYFTFWIVPLFSIFPAIVRLRIVTEHFSPDHDIVGEKPFISRSTCNNRLEDYFIGCDMQFHFEHHLLPMIPHAQLSRLHDSLVGMGFFQTLPEETDYLSHGYLRFWWRLLTDKIPPRTNSL